MSVNPTGIFGPALTAEARSSLQLIKGMVDGTMTVVPRQRFGVADVRDVADAHIRAMTTLAAVRRETRIPLLAELAAQRSATREGR